MSFFDDIGDAISDVTSAVGEGVSTLASEAYSTVLSPTESFAMKGLGAAGSAVSSLFGDLEISDIGETLGNVGKFAAFPVLGMPALASDALGSVIADSSIPGFLKNNSIAEILDNNSITQLIEENPLAGMVAGNIKEDNQGLFDVAEMLLGEKKRSQDKMGLGLLGNKVRMAPRAVNRMF